MFAAVLYILAIILWLAGHRVTALILGVIAFSIV